MWIPVCESIEGLLHVAAIVYSCCYSITVAVTPGPVQNLTATVDAHAPSVMLNWDPQDNQCESYPITKYDVRFKLEEGEHYNERTIEAPTVSIVLGRDLRLKPLLKYDFKVRARNAYIAGRWETVKKYVGKQRYFAKISTILH